MPLTGYFPGKRLRMVGDLPRGVIAQRRRWCLDREYVVGAEGAAVRAQYARVTQPILAISFTDDHMMSEGNIRSLHGFYGNANVRHQRLAPCEVAERQIGHFGFFREQYCATLWPLIPQWLEAKLTAEKKNVRNREITHVCIRFRSGGGTVS